MHPIERLRFIARAVDESAVALAAEAAWTLGELGSEDPAAVVTASKRLLERQPSCGPLWWVCAGVIRAADATEAAHQLADELFSDPVPDELGRALRATCASSDAVSALPPLDTLRAALERHPHEVRVIAPYRRLRSELRLLAGARGDVGGYDPSDAAAALTGSVVLLVEPALASARGLMLERWGAGVIATAIRHEVPVWAVLPTGRVVDSSVAEAARRLSSGEMTEVAAEDVTAAVSSAGGLSSFAGAISANASPPPPELARWLRQVR